MTERVEQTPELRLGGSQLENTSIALAKVTPWHRFAEHLRLDSNAVHLSVDGQAYLCAWKCSNGQYRNNLLPMSVRPDASWAPWETAQKNWRCDIGDIHGLNASKAPLHCYSSLSQMICTERPEMIADPTDQVLERLLENLGMRFDRPQAGDYFVQHTWDGRRTYIVNDDGSHRLAGAQRLAAVLGTKVQLHGRLVSRYIDAEFMQTILDQFQMFLIPTLPWLDSNLTRVIEQTGATYATSRMPVSLDEYAPQLQCATIVWLPRAQWRAQCVANTLRHAGILDLNRHLAHLLVVQAAH